MPKSTTQYSFWVMLRRRRSHPDHGQIVGHRPAKVEVNAKFVHGNSGSPIMTLSPVKSSGLHVCPAGQTDVLQQAANASPLHWFGYRLDTIKQWEELDWKRFSSEGQQLAKAEALDNSFIDFAQQLHTKPASSVHSTNTQINDIFAAYFEMPEARTKLAASTTWRTRECATLPICRAAER